MSIVLEELHLIRHELFLSTFFSDRLKVVLIDGPAKRSEAEEPTIVIIGISKRPITCHSHLKTTRVKKEEQRPVLKRIDERDNSQVDGALLSPSPETERKQGLLIFVASLSHTRPKVRLSRPSFKSLLLQPFSGIDTVSF